MQLNLLFLTDIPHIKIYELSKFTTISLRNKYYLSQVLSQVFSAC